MLSVRIKELEAIRYVITHHEESTITSTDAKAAIRDALESIDSAVRLLTHASAVEHTHTQESTAEDEWHDNDVVMLTPAALELN